MRTATEILSHFIRQKRKAGYITAPKDLMSSWYKEATSVYRLSAHYDVFEDCINNDITYDRRAWWRNRPTLRWRNSFCVSESFIEDGKWQFQNIEYAESQEKQQQTFWEDTDI